MGTFEISIFSFCFILLVQSTKVLTIVTATEFFQSKLTTTIESRIGDEKCEVQCKFIAKSAIEAGTSYDAFIYHSRNLDEVEWAPRTDARLNLLFSMEPPTYRGEASFGQVPDHFFNGTIGYSSLNTFIFDYDVSAQKRILVKDITGGDFLAKKTESVLGVISNCGTPSDRETLIAALRAHVPMTLYGSCYQGRVPDEQFDEMIATHRFVLALENSACEEYVTEKALRFKTHLIVPIVISRALVKGLLPSDAFIALDDYASMAEMAEHLAVLQRNDTEYAKFFAWRERAEVHPVKRRGVCEMCKQLHKNGVNLPSPRRPSFPDERMCTPELARTIFNLAKPPINWLLYGGLAVVITFLILCTILCCIQARRKKNSDVQVALQSLPEPR